MEDIRQLIEVIQRLPPPPPVKWKNGKSLLSDGKITCKCGKLKVVQDLEPLNTGVIRILNNVCKDCPTAISEDRQLARVVCCCCKQVVARMAPHKTPVGFTYERNRTYHVDKCLKCHPGLQESLILEELIFNRARGNGRLRA